MDALIQLSAELLASSDRTSSELGRSLASAIDKGMLPASPRELLAQAAKKAVLLDLPISDLDLSAVIEDTMSKIAPVHDDGGRLIGHLINPEIKWTARRK